MDWLRFWEWDLWQWLGGVIASQPFLTLMVPVATLTGVIITTKSNERVRRRELHREAERWRYDVLQDSATEQRRAVLKFLEESRAATVSMLARVDTVEREYRSKGFSNEKSFVESRIDLYFWYLNQVHPMVTKLELEIKEPHVFGEVLNLRSALVALEKELADLSGLSSEESVAWLKHNFPEYRPELGPVLRMKEAAIKHLHPLPPEVPMEQPPRCWLPRLSQNPFPAGEENN